MADFSSPLTFTSSYVRDFILNSNSTSTENSTTRTSTTTSGIGGFQPWIYQEGYKPPEDGKIVLGTPKVDGSNVTYSVWANYEAKNARLSTTSDLSQPFVQQEQLLKFKEVTHPKDKSRTVWTASVTLPKEKSGFAKVSDEEIEEISGPMPLCVDTSKL